MSKGIAGLRTRNRAPRRLVVVLSVVLAVLVSGGFVVYLNPDLPMSAPPPSEIRARWPGCAQLAFNDQTAQSSELMTDPPKGGALPAGFIPASAILCAERVNDRGAGGVDGLERRSTELGPLLTYLARPSRWTLRSVNCLSLGWIPPWLVLVDDSSRWVAPSVPLDACGFALDLFKDSGPAYNNLAYTDAVVASLD